MYAKETSNVYEADTKAGTSWIQFRELWHIPRQCYTEINSNDRHQWQNPHVHQLGRQIKCKNVLFALKIQEVTAFTLYQKHIFETKLLYYCIFVLMYQKHCKGFYREGQSAGGGEGWVLHCTFIRGYKRNRWGQRYPTSAIQPFHQPLITHITLFYNNVPISWLSSSSVEPSHTQFVVLFSSAYARVAVKPTQDKYIFES